VGFTPCLFPCLRHVCESPPPSITWWASHLIGFISSIYMYVNVLLTKPLRSQHKTSSSGFYTVLPLLGGYETLLVSICATCMPMSSSLNHLGQHIKPPLGGFHTLLVSISATCMPKSSSMIHFGQHINHRLVGSTPCWFPSLRHVCKSPRPSTT